MVNGTSFEAPSVPVLLQIMSGAKQPSDLLPKGSIYGLEPNKSVELVIPGGVLGGPVSPIHSTCCTLSHDYTSSIPSISTV